MGTNHQFNMKFKDEADEAVFMMRFKDLEGMTF